MYDTLDGLDYKIGECSKYVAYILKDIRKSHKNGDIIKLPRDKVKIGDVIVDDYSSHLVTDKDFPSRITIRPPMDESECQQNINDSNDDVTRQTQSDFFSRKETFLWVIPNYVLRRLQMNETK
jgi:hypothetical protein